MTQNLCPKWPPCHEGLGGGFTYCLFSPLKWGRWTHFDLRIFFQIGWSNHQLEEDEPHFTTWRDGWMCFTIVASLRMLFVLGWLGNKFTSSLRPVMVVLVHWSRRCWGRSGVCVLKLVVMASHSSMAGQPPPLTYPPPEIRPYYGFMKTHWFPLIRMAIKPLFLGRVH